MRTLSIGSSGYDVTFLQRLLNKRGASPALSEDGAFGPRTQTALIAFQRANSVTPPNGTAGPSTWLRLGPVSERIHPMTGYSQPDTNSCWSAAATMMMGTNMSVGPGRAAILTAAPVYGQLQDSLDNIETFVQGLGWRLINNSTRPPASEIIHAISRGPAWVAFLGQNFGHAVVFSGVLNDGSMDGTGTVFRVHDPWPPRARSVSVYGTTYLGGTVWLRSVRPPKAAMIAYIAQP